MSHVPSVHILWDAAQPQLSYHYVARFLPNDLLTDIEVFWSLAHALHTVIHWPVVSEPILRMDNTYHMKLIILIVIHFDVHFPGRMVVM